MNGAIVLNLGMRGVIADLITHVFVNRFRGMGVLTHRNFAISVGLAGRSHNSVCLSTAVLHCENTHNADRYDEVVLICSTERRRC